jgi:predicted short-subunit dehydrogenase-like oxidoreductase (DUF2520 family)
VDNVAAMGPAAALTGPAVRGDAPTVEANLAALAAAAPEAVPVYVVLCRSMADLAVHAGRLDAHRRDAVDRVLVAWT